MYSKTNIFIYRDNTILLMARKTTSLKIDEDLWKEVKKHCIDQNTEISEYIENIIRKDLKIKV